VAEKKPLMESAWATAAELTAKAVRTTRRLSMGSPNIMGFEEYLLGLSSKWMRRQLPVVGSHAKK
jgi:hypothetical protein